jgi:hypothetical protein
MPRIEDGIQVPEGLASKAISELAEEIQELCYMLDAQNVPPATVKVLYRAYRVLKSVTEYYLGDNSPLHWDAPDYRFQPKPKGTACSKSTI